MISIYDLCEIYISKYLVIYIYIYSFRFVSSITNIIIIIKSHKSGSKI